MAQVEQSRDLPEEVWKEILSKLWLNEEDLEHLLICRKVCRSWEKLVDQLPSKLYWNPWLKHRLDDYNTFGYSIATIINSDSCIRKFLSCDFESERNHFRNYTLSIFLEDIEKEKENLLKIIEDHGQHVRKFLYHPAKDFQGRLSNIPQLLAHMKNIRTLVLDCGNLSTKQQMAIDGKNFPKDLNKLSELVLRPEYACFPNDMKDDETMYAKLSVNYGSQIKSITIVTYSLHLDPSKIVERFPNLEDFSVKCSSIDSDVVLPPSGIQWPKLKRLTLATCCAWSGSTALTDMLKVAGCFAGTLQLLSLGINFDLDLKKALCESNQTNDPVVITTYPKLTQLIIPFWMIRHLGQPTNIPLETHFRFSIPNLKLLFLDDTYDEFRDRDISGAELEEICASFWHLIPSSVETISVRIKKINQVLNLVFPVVYKCKKKVAA